MSETNNIIKSNKNQYHHLTLDDRTKIQSLIEQVDDDGRRIFSNSYIADYIGIHKSTISRELKRIKSKINIRSGKIKNKPYNAEDAQNDYQFKRAMSKANYILDDFPKLKKYIEDKIKIDKWAPDAISGYINSHELYKQDGFTSISTTTIYRAIHYGLLKLLYNYDDDALINIRRYCKENNHRKYKPLTYNELICFIEEAIAELVNAPYIYDFRPLE